MPSISVSSVHGFTSYYEIMRSKLIAFVVGATLAIAGSYFYWTCCLRQPSSRDAGRGGSKKSDFDVKSQLIQLDLERRHPDSKRDYTINQVLLKVDAQWEASGSATSIIDDPASEKLRQLARTVIYYRIPYHELPILWTQVWHSMALRLAVADAMALHLDRQRLQADEVKLFNQGASLDAIDWASSEGSDGLDSDRVKLLALKFPNEFFAKFVRDEASWKALHPHKAIHVNRALEMLGLEDHELIRKKRTLDAPD